MRMRPDGVVVFAFGDFARDFARDQYKNTNWHMARRAEFLAKKFKIRIVTPKDIPVDITRFKVLFAEDAGKKKYISTLDVAKEAVKLAKKMGWRKIKVVAAPPHEWRCRRDLRRLGLKEVEGDDYFRSTREFPPGFWFSKKSTQWWTRSLGLWWLREIPLRLMPWWLYKKIA